MSDQSLQRRFQYWVGVFVLLVALVTVLVAVPLLQAGRHYQRGVGWAVVGAASLVTPEHG